MELKENLGALDTQTPEQASKNPVWISEFGGFRAQGVQKRSSCRATEGTLNTQTPEQASKNPVWSPEGSEKARFPYTVHRNALQWKVICDMMLSLWG